MNQIENFIKKSGVNTEGLIHSSNLAIDLKKEIEKAIKYLNSQLKDISKMVKGIKGNDEIKDAIKLESIAKNFKNVLKNVDSNLLK